MVSFAPNNSQFKCHLEHYLNIKRIHVKWLHMLPIITYLPQKIKKYLHRTIRKILTCKDTYRDAHCHNKSGNSFRGIGAIKLVPTYHNSYLYCLRSQNQIFWIQSSLDAWRMIILILSSILYHTFELPNFITMISYQRHNQQKC